MQLRCAEGSILAAWSCAEDSHPIIECPVSVASQLLTSRIWEKPMSGNTTTDSTAGSVRDR